ncbi:MAG: peptidase C39 [Lachnospiraceae bacterium]|nr:peptidase C39 [Lachnospiraceae bacterium]
MKNLLNYQSTEFDCGPVSLLNAFRYLFDREELPPDLAKFIMLYCNDAHNPKGEIGKHGTSCAAMRFMASFLNDYSMGRNFPIYCKFLGRQDVLFEKGHRIYNFIKNGGVVVLRLHIDVAHYVLLTDIEDDHVLMFDPYYEEKDDPDFDPLYFQDGIEFIWDQPKKANRRISFERLNQITEDYYHMGPVIDREAILIERTSSELVKQK